MALGLRGPSALTVCIWLGACHASSAAQAPPGDAEKRLPATPVNAVDPARAFVVRQVKRGELLLMSSETGAARVLASASAGLLEPRLGLLWMRNGKQLQVLDLDRLDQPPLTIAQGLPDIYRLEITGPHDSVATEDGCDLASIELDWSAEPQIACILDPTPGMRVTNAGWLEAQRKRALRTPAKRLDFEDAGRKTRLPAKLLSCEVEESCGATLPLGATGLELVLVRQEVGGDCVHVGCLLRDPKSRLFATPPHAQSWGPANKTRPGTCGPFMFDRAQKRYLVDSQLCAADSGCKPLPGPALGWLEPGDTVGTPGIVAGE